MSQFHDRSHTSAILAISRPSAGQLLLFFLVLTWLAVAPILVGLATAFLTDTWLPILSHLFAVMLLAGLLLLPCAGFVGLVRWLRWDNLRPLALALLLTSVYVTVAAAIRAITEPIEFTGDLSARSEPIQRLTLLTLTAFGLGTLGLRRAGLPRSLPALVRGLGLARPPLAGLAAALSLAAVLTIGWPLTGALGDSRTSGLIVLRALAISLPEMIFFWGTLFGVLLSSYRQHKVFVGLICLLTYVASTPSLIVPHNDWGKLVLLISSIPFALMMLELRVLTGSIWSGLLFSWAYRATPLLFTDPRVELPFITQPWQTSAHLWMILGAGCLALVLWGGRAFLTPRWRLPAPATTALSLATALSLWAIWYGAWLNLGYPGFHNDGFLIIIAEQSDLAGAEDIPDLNARRAFVRDRLIETAERTQAPIRAALDAAGLRYRPFYLINMIEVEGHHRQMNDFADLPGVDRVMLNPNVRPYPWQVPFGYGSTPSSGQGAEWNISQAQANQVWAMGITGQGIVVAGQDTGYDWTHPALQRAYRGFNTGNVEHTYNWHDAWSNALIPFDDSQHGTHTMGIILGDDGHSNQIGMAPGAQWIGCRNMLRGIGNPASYTDCMEFFLAPYPPGADPFTEGDVSKAPHIINNSWGCPGIEGCDDRVLEPATAALEAAGIMMIVSAGNSGPGCQTVNDPPARYESVFSVGATNNKGAVTGFSSRGPVPHSDMLLKPDIVAPGENIRSSLPGGSYGTADGTSMAGPHVAGLVALMWSANPDLSGRTAETEDIIRQSARQVAVKTTCEIQPRSSTTLSLLEQARALANPTLCACGNVTGTPNNVYGWGEIDALKAVKLALDRRK